VQSFPTPAGKHVVSRGGGREPRWRGDGKELFFLAPDGTLMAATIDTTKDFRVLSQQSLFRTGIISTQNNHPYVVARDGKRFLMPISETTTADQVTVVVNWTSERRVTCKARDGRGARCEVRRATCECDGRGARCEVLASPKHRRCEGGPERGGAIAARPVRPMIARSIWRV
jgi:hypothetical protein